MKHAVTRELFAYWTRLRAGRAAPDRGDIDPAAIRGILSDTFILDTGLTGAEPTFRLSGTRLNALFLHELKGRPVLDLWVASDRPGAARLIQTVQDHVTPAIAGLQGRPAGCTPIDLELLLVPLRHHGRTHARVLGSIAPFEIPSWLGLIAIDHLTITSLRWIDAGEPVPAKPVAWTRPATYAPPRQHGFLTVYQGGR